MKTALLVIDIQKDYFPGGKFPLVNPETAAKKAYELLQCFREHSGHHVHIQHISIRPDATFFIKGDSGSDIHDLAAHFEGEPIVYKHYPNSFRETKLLEILKKWGIERVVISGMMTHMCVDATTRAAADLGFQVIVEVLNIVFYFFNFFNLFAQVVVHGQFVQILQGRISPAVVHEFSQPLD